MAKSDYICCVKCGTKLFYHGDDYSPIQSAGYDSFCGECFSELRLHINRLTAAASNLLAKHRLGAISEADVRWMEKELQEVKP